MSKVVTTARTQINEIIMQALGRAVADEALPAEAMPAFIVEIPADTSHGDFASNAAMVSARAFRQSPRNIAQALVERMDFAGTYIERAEIAGPGFINFFASHAFFEDIVRDVEASDSAYGRSDYGSGKRVLVEFVSANPTGPMHIGNARGGAIGDCLASVMEAAGYSVEREFYINDAGNQIEKFGLSLDIRYQQIFLGENAPELPEDSYHGADILARAQEYADIHGDALMNVSEEERRRELTAFALPKNIDGLREDLAKYRITYDTWFRESVLHSSGAVRAVVDLLTERGLTYEKDGAIWYKSGLFCEKYGVKDAKDEVLIRQNGNPTYFAADIAYHMNKLATRGFDICINIWGADHHGHVARLKGALDAVGLNGEQLDIVLMKLVNLLYNGEVVRVSKRTGKAVQLVDLLDEVPVDSARFFFNMRDASSPLDFDMAVAAKQDSQNPVYYCQYAHARICSVFRNAKEKNAAILPASDCRLELLTSSEEIELIRCMGALTGEVETAAKEYNPSMMTKYLVTLASKFHKYYNSAHVIEDDADITSARLALCNAVRICLRNVLEMLKISVPERMDSVSNAE